MSVIGEYVSAFDDVFFSNHSLWVWFFGGLSSIVLFIILGFVFCVWSSGNSYSPCVSLLFLHEFF